MGRGSFSTGVSGRISQKPLPPWAVPVMARMPSGGHSAELGKTPR